MCLVTFAWQAHSRYPLVVAANRDEWRQRPTEPAHEWDGILGGRDRQAGGTWLGITRTGRFAALTNVREPSVARAGAPSRGALVTDYLQSANEPRAHLEELVPAAYAGFNLLVGTNAALAYFGSQRGEAQTVVPGVHGLSNHRLDEPWPKVERSKAALAAALAADEPSVEVLFDMLSDVTPVADAALPDTGVGLALERRLAPILLVGSDYGTRCSTVLRVRGDGFFELHERTRDADGRVVSAVILTRDDPPRPFMAPSAASAPGGAWRRSRSRS